MQIQYFSGGLDGSITPGTGSVAVPLGILRTAAQRLAARERLVVRADGVSLDVRRGSEDWGPRIEALQTEALVFGAEQSLQPLRLARADAFTPAASPFGAQDLVQAFGKVYRELQAPVVFPDMYKVESTIAVGAESYRVRMHEPTGEAQRYRMGQSVPQVSIGTKTFDRPMLTYIIGYEIGWLFAANGAFAGVDLNAEHLAAGRDFIWRTIDGLLFNGADDCWGWKNYPGLGSYTETVAIGSMTADQLSVSMIGAMRRPVERSKTALVPTILEVAPEIFTRAQQLKIDTASGKTVAQWFEEQPDGKGGRYKLRQNWRLSSSGPGSTPEHGMFAHGDATSTMSAEVMPPVVVQGESNAFSTKTYIIGQTGGLLNPYPLGMEKVFIPAS